jgi:hypothetical protein
VYTLIRHAPLRQALTAEAPACLISFVIAETFYKFHSFTLECIAFLLTWSALSFLFSLAARRLSTKAS